MEIFKNDVKKKLWLFYSIGIFTITIILNFRCFILNSNKSILNFLMSSIYLITWFYLMKKLNKNIIFFKGASIFWVITLMVTILYYFLYELAYTGENFAPIALIFLSPIYSIGELIAPYSNLKIIIIMIVTGGMFLINYKKLLNLEEKITQNEEEN